MGSLGNLVDVDARIDIRNAELTTATMQSIAPDVVIHMAAQPLVRASYADPRGTVETNVTGTMNVLEAMAKTPSVQAAVIVTTDKVYRNVGKVYGYVEDDPLGGRDPYAASKAMADMLSSSWSSSFRGPSLGIARAGNVIGGGDVSTDRLLPDLIRSFSSGHVAPVRAPASVRPWQHVLDCLHGYILLTESLLTRPVHGDAWNFGPEPEAFRTVSEVATLSASFWGKGASWERIRDDGPHEAALLTLNSEKSRIDLGWKDYLDFNEAVAWTVDWAQRVASGADPLDATMKQVRDFLLRARP